jgi:hypothetical protein
MIPIFSPPNCTPWWCLIDDKIGTSFRQLVYIYGLEWETEYMKTHSNGKISAGERRVLMAQWVQRAFKTWTETPKYAQHIINAAARCGMRFPITELTPENASEALGLARGVEYDWKKCCPPRFHRDNEFASFPDSVYNLESEKKQYTFTFARPDNGAAIQRFELERVGDGNAVLVEPAFDDSSEEIINVVGKDDDGGGNDYGDLSSDEVDDVVDGLRRRRLCGDMDTCGCSGGRGGCRLCICSSAGEPCDEDCGCDAATCLNRARVADQDGEGENARVISALIGRRK